MTTRYPRSRKCRWPSVCGLCRAPIRMNERELQLGGRWVCLPCALLRVDDPYRPAAVTEAGA